MGYYIKAHISIYNLAGRISTFEFQHCWWTVNVFTVSPCYRSFKHFCTSSQFSPRGIPSITPLSPLVLLSFSYVILISLSTLFLRLAFLHFTNKLPSLYTIFMSSSAFLNPHKATWFTDGTSCPALNLRMMLNSSSFECRFSWKRHRTMPCKLWKRREHLICNTTLDDKLNWQACCLLANVMCW